MVEFPTTTKLRAQTQHFARGPWLAGVVEPLDTFAEKPLATTPLAAGPAGAVNGFEP